MSVDDLARTAPAALQWAAEHPLTVLAAIVLATFLGTPVKGLLAGLAGLLRAPAQFVEAELGPVLRGATPWTLGRLLRGLRGYFGPVLDRPARALGAALMTLWRALQNVAKWPVETITGAIVGLLSPLMERTAALAEGISARAAAAASTAINELRGRSDRWAGWRVIGGLLFFGGLLCFLYADAVLSIASHEQAIGATVTFLPDFFREATLAFAIASFLSALMLGLVIFDLLGMTHLGPWDELGTTTKRWLGVVVAATALTSLALALFLSLWRSSIVVAGFIPADVARTLEGIALTLPIPLMLIATALIAWGAIAMPWIAWILVLGAGALVLRLAALVLQIANAVLQPAAVLLGGLIRIAGVIGLVALLAGMVVLFAGYFGVSVVAVGLVLALGLGGVAAWIVAWVAGHLTVQGLALLAKLTDAIAVVAQRAVDALMYPGRVVWNWLASFDTARRLHLEPIAVTDPRIVRIAPPPDEELERAV